MAETASLNSGSPFRNLSSIVIVKKIIKYLSLLAKKEFQLVKTELQHDLRSEVFMVIWFSVAAVFGFLSLLALLYTIITLLNLFLDLWFSALIMFLFLSLLSLVFLIIGYRKLVKAPLDRTKEVIKSDIGMTKRGLS
ncbi:MAG: phage holin family protein [Fibrobacter sp.]|nr:phage holin family protein [Fibrobacter sp.]